MIGPFSTIRHGLTRFRVSFGSEEARFNESVLMDIMYLGNWPVLNIIDDGASFSAARFLPDVSSKTIWKHLSNVRPTHAQGCATRSSLTREAHLGRVKYSFRWLINPIWKSVAQEQNFETHWVSAKGANSLFATNTVRWKMNTPKPIRFSS